MTVRSAGSRGHPWSSELWQVCTVLLKGPEKARRTMRLEFGRHACGRGPEKEAFLPGDLRELQGASAELVLAPLPQKLASNISPLSPKASVFSSVKTGQC